MATITKRFNREGELIGWQAKIRRPTPPVPLRALVSHQPASNRGAEAAIRMADVDVTYGPEPARPMMMRILLSGYAEI